MLRRLGKESVLYGAGQIITRSLSVFVLPLVTRAFAVEQVGMLELLSMLESIAVIACTLGLDSSVNFHYWDSKEDPETQKSHVISGLLAVTVLSSLTLAVLLALDRPLTAAYGLQSQNEVYRLCVASVPLAGMFSYVSRLCRVYQRPILFNVLAVADLLIYMAGFAVCAYMLRLGLVSVYISRVIAHFLSAALGLLVLRRSLAGKFRSRLVWEQLKYGLPLVPILLIDWLMKFADRYFINLYHGTSDVGIYGVASKVSMASILVIGSFRMAWGPYSMSIKDSPKAPRVYARVALIFLVGVLAFVLVIQAVAPIMVVVLSTREYLSATDIVSVLSLGVCLSGMFNIVSVGPSVTKQTYLITLGTAVGVVSNVFLNMLMIPRYGNFGAAIATSIGYGVSVVFIFIASQSRYPIPYDFRRLGFAAAAFVVCYVAAIILGHSLGERFLLRALAGLVLVAVFAGAIHGLGVFHLSQVPKLLRRALRRPARGGSAGAQT